MNTYASSEKLAALGKNYTPKVPYPNTALANKLKLAAQLIDGGIGARIFYVAIDGFDTHAGQGGATGAHANLLQQVSDGGRGVLPRPRRPRAQGPRLRDDLLRVRPARARERQQGHRPRLSGARCSSSAAR